MTWTAEQIAAVHKWAQELSASEIGKRLGVSRNAVIGIAARQGISLQKPWMEPRKPNWSPERAARRRQQRAAKRAIIMLIPPKPVPTEAPPPRNLTVLELELGDCRWPVTDRPPHFFCGNPQVPNLSYCPYHARRAVA